MNRADVLDAARRIAPYIRQTPLTYDPEHNLYLKWENHQLTGSFKARGAFNKILSLSPSELSQGLVAASAGNHGQGVALAGQQAGAQVTIFASEHAVPAKIEAMRRLGAEVRLVPGGYGEAEQAGLEHARLQGAVWVSPYNDEQVITGQGTLALEAAAQLPTGANPVWVVPIGGGGLVAGIGLALKGEMGAEPELTSSQQPARLPSDARLVAAQSEASPFFYALYYQGQQTGVEELPSLADGLSGPVEEGSMTIELVRRLADAVVLVSEAQVSAAIAHAWRAYQERIEGSAAVALAAAFALRQSSGPLFEPPGRPVLVVISGGNIQPETFEENVSRWNQP